MEAMESKSPTVVPPVGLHTHCRCGQCFERTAETSRRRCTTCHSLYTQLARRSITAWIDGLKRGHFCVQCGHSDHRALVFVHRPDTGKQFEVEGCSRITVDRHKIAIEIAKCDVLCRNCVAQSTYEAEATYRDADSVAATIREREEKGKEILAALGIAV